MDVDEDGVVGLVLAEDPLRQDRAVDAVRCGEHVRGVQGKRPVQQTANNLSSSSAKVDSLTILDNVIPTHLVLASRIFASHSCFSSSCPGFNSPHSQHFFSFLVLLRFIDDTA